MTEKQLGRLAMGFGVLFVAVVAIGMAFGLYN